MEIFGITVTWQWVIWVAAAVAAVAFIRAGARSAKRKINRSIGTLTGLGTLISAAKEAAVNETQDETKPRSLSGGDPLFLAQIKKDFPDFSIIAAKEAVSEYMKNEFAEAEGFRVHKSAICDYRRSGGEKTVVFQCAFELREASLLRQKRYILHYTHKSDDGGEYSSQTCPSCGAAIRPGATECAYCGSRLVMNRAAWEITEAREG